MVTEFAVLLGGEERPVIRHAAVDAAVLVIADANQFAGPRNRERFEQYGMDQREDGCGCADAQCQGKNGSDRKSWRLEKLPKRIAYIVKKH